MGTWTSFVVLALAVVSTLSLPRPDMGYHIPDVGEGSRAQYYVLHSDGSFKYGYDTEDGLYEQSNAKAPGEVTGAFGYRDAAGQEVKLQYTADERGFLPRGSHLPVAPEGDFGSRVRAASSPTATVRGSAASFVPPSSSPVASSAPVEVANIRSSAGGDGSYSFGYEASSSSRLESADARNSVTGQYAFTADDGVNRAINYIAGSQTGYIAEGDSLPVGPAVPGAESGIPTGRILPILSEDEANALAAATSGGATSYAVKTPTTASRSRFPAQISVPRTKSAPSGSSDASYSFSYDTEDSARSETADSDLNVRGSYSFTPPEGHTLTVNYAAGSNTGFVATGDHLPEAPEAGSSPRLSGNDVSFRASSPVKTPATYSASAPATPVEVAQVRSATGDDGSGSFSYETSSSSRSESANARNTVTGQYAFTADDGINRAIKYTASSKTGYIAEGDSLPRGPPVPGAESGIPTGRIYPILSEEEANALAAATSGSASATAYVAPSPSASAVPSASSDASYSFHYDAEDSARRESADADLNIQGSYSFVPPEGHRLTVNYIAGSDTGFVATGDHLPTGPDDGAVPYSALSPTSSSALPSPAAPTSFSSQSANPFVSVNTASTRPSDASYSFNYDARDSSRSESADANLNVQGSYSFVPPEGQRLTVNYVAGSDTGFIATGDHLPVAPKADTPSLKRNVPTITGVATYSSASPAAATPVAAAQVRSTSASDGSYSFQYEAPGSSRSESADVRNSVAGHYAFVADDGINRKINYIASSKTGYIAEGDSLPIGPPVPGAESGIPTGRILPALSEQEANALAAASSASAASPLLKASPSGQTSATPADASYSFSFKSDSYSRNEEADVDGNVVGSYTFLDEHGNEHTVDFVAGRETGFLPEGFPTPEESAGTAVAYSSPSRPIGISYKNKYSSSPAQKTSPAGHTGQIVGDVLLQQYDAVNRDKFGYVFTAVRR